LLQQRRRRAGGGKQERTLPCRAAQNQAADAWVRLADGKDMFVREFLRMSLPVFAAAAAAAAAAGGQSSTDSLQVGVWLEVCCCRSSLLFSPASTTRF